MAAGAIASPSRPSPNASARLATVARERASEQSAQAIAAPDIETAGLHLEREAYLVKLAEVYERRARDSAAAA